MGKRARVIHGNKVRGPGRLWPAFVILQWIFVHDPWNHRPGQAKAFLTESIRWEAGSLRNLESMVVFSVTATTWHPCSSERC